MSLAAGLAFARFLGTGGRGGLSDVDDEALGAAIVGFASRIEDGQHMKLPIHLADLSGSHSLAFEIGQFSFNEKLHGPLRLELGRLQEPEGPSLGLSELPAGQRKGDWKVDKAEGKPFRRAVLRLRSYRDGAAAAVRIARSPVLKRFELKTLGQALRPLALAVEVVQGSVGALLACCQVARVIGEALHENAETITVTTWGAVVRGRELGDWKVTIAPLGKDPESEPTGPMEGGVIDLVKGSRAGRAREAKKFLSMKKVTSLTRTYDKTDQGGMTMTAIAFQGPANDASEGPSSPALR